MKERKEECEASRPNAKGHFSKKIRVKPEDLKLDKREQAALSEIFEWSKNSVSDNFVLGEPYTC